MTERTIRNALRTVLFLTAGLLSACRDRETAPSMQKNSALIVSDSTLFTFVTQTQPFQSYTLFPKVDSVISGSLNGSTAHQPLVRVSMNATAFGALQNGRLPSGGSFPDGSAIFKEIRNANGTATLYAIIYKERNNPLANNGWVWAEYNPMGSVAFSITNSGNGCISCHSREQGPQNDFVRTFERQR